MLAMLVALGALLPLSALVMNESSSPDDDSEDRAGAGSADPTEDGGFVTLDAFLAQAQSAEESEDDVVVIDGYLNELHAEDVALPPQANAGGEGYAHGHDDHEADHDEAEEVDGATADAKPTDSGTKGGGKGGGDTTDGGTKGGGKGGGKGDGSTDGGTPDGGETDGGTTDGTDTGDGTPTDGGTDDTVVSSYVSGPEGGYNIEIVFSGTWTPELQQAFISAADYLSEVILADVPDVGGTYAADDIAISAALTEIDGAGGVLGRAGPTVIRSDSGLPVQGIMEFDSADADYYQQNGLWEDIVLHEMMHALGLGTLWNYLGLTSGSIEAGDLRFTGDMATAAYEADFFSVASTDGGSGSGVPIETHGGSGTAGGHWDEALFDNEIATGYIDMENYVSGMTLAALDDMGYDTFFEDPANSTDRVGVRPADPLLSNALYA